MSTKRLCVLFAVRDPAECVTMGKIIENQQEGQQRASTERENAQRLGQKRLLSKNSTLNDVRLT